MPEEFYNPFHFVPVAKPELELLSRKSLEEVPSERTSGQHVTHDRYVEKTLRPPGKAHGAPTAEAVYSGRIVCRLRTESPTVIGAHRDDSQHPARVFPYELPAFRDKQLVLEPAIPETSLRGMISSVFESLTNSSLRVLNNAELSVRMRAMRSGQEQSEALHAVGFIHVGADGRRQLLPLSFPSLRGRVGRFDIPYEYHKFESFLQVRVYLDGNEDRHSSSADTPQIYFLKDRIHHTVSNHAIQFKASDARHLKVRGGLIGRTGENGLLITFDAWNTLPAVEKAMYTPGLLRIMRGESRDEIQDARETALRRTEGDQLPRNVRHEWFIPLAPQVYDPATNRFQYIANRLPLIDAEQVACQFERIAKTRTQDQAHLPFELRGSLRNAEIKKRDQPQTHAIRLRHGDLVCFGLTQSDPPALETISISSIWRKSAGTVHGWFEQIGQDLLPMNSRRTQVTLAEQLFGFVESDAPSLGTESPHSPQDKRIKALAGRVKFSSGRLCSDHHDSEQVYLPEVKLQILSSPKLPCPALYFKRSNGRPGGIPKSQLPPVPQPHIEPQGRKTYLIHDPRLARWSTSQPDKHLEQKVRVRPLKAGVDFVFDLSFDNLSETELGLLLLSLKPNDQFRHRIGLGKPLGLGTVEILPVGLFLVDRKTRYAADPLNSKRYHQVLLSSTASGVLLNLAHAAPDVAARYQSEQLALRGATDASRWPMLTQAARQRLQDLRLPTLQAVEALGDPATTIGMPVIYPQIPNSAVLPPNQRGAHSEEELFQWHTENERRGENLQYLQPLTSTQPKPQPLQKRVER